MACTAALDATSLRGILSGLPSLPSPCAYAVPHGCVVRNTFLEWQEQGDDGEDGVCAEVSLRGEGPPPSRALLDSKLRRAQSCPCQLVVRARGATWEGMSYVRSQSDGVPSDDAARHNDASQLPSKCGSLSTGDLPASVEAAAARSGARGGARMLRQPPAELNMETAGEEPPAWSRGWTPQGQRSPNHREGRPQKPNGGRPSLVLRGLPYHVTEADVISFIEQSGALQALAPMPAVVLLSNPQGRPSGFAEIFLAKHANFWEVQEKLHMQRLGGRYIEALPPKGGKTGGGTPMARHGSKQRETWRRQA